MRTSFQSDSRLTLANVRAAQARRLTATNEVSSGIRVGKPSDSPTDAAEIVRGESDLRSIAQIRTNLRDVNAELRSVDGFLFQAEDVLTRVETLAAQAGGGTVDATGRAAIRDELSALLRHLVTLGNSTHGGLHVFAGGAGDTAPFVIDAAAPDGVRYVGDTSGRSVRFPDGRPARFSLPGSAIFLTPQAARGSGRSPATLGAAATPPVGLGLAFSGDLDTVLSVDLKGFFVAAAPPTGASAGDTVAVRLVSQDGSIDQTITTPALAGGETAAALAGLLNAEAAANADLAGLVVFSDEGGSLKLTLSDTARQGFTFTSTSTGSVTSGLETGAELGGYSAKEIAAALNAAAALNPQLKGAKVRFSAVNGEVEVSGSVDFSVSVVDFARGTGFASGLAGTHIVGGASSANVFGTLNRLIAAVGAGDQAAIEQGVADLSRAQEHVNRAHGFYGATLRQVDVTIGLLADLQVVNEQRLSERRDADLIDSISRLTQATSAEQFALEVAARRQPTLLDLLA